MSQIDELQSRITAALDRIGQGMDTLSDGATGADGAELDRLKQELQDEKLAGEQLRERVKTLRQRRVTLEKELEQAKAEGAEAIKGIDAELQSLRQANETLRENNSKLREANSAGVAEPELINSALQAELDGLRADRQAERAETEAVMKRLAQALDGTAESPGAPAADATPSEDA